MLLLSHLLILSFSYFLLSCSTKKNTPATRFYHATTARFNILYNGQLSYIDGVELVFFVHTDRLVDPTNELLNAGSILSSYYLFPCSAKNP